MLQLEVALVFIPAVGTWSIFLKLPGVAPASPEPPLRRVERKHGENVGSTSSRSRKLYEEGTNVKYAR